MKINLIVVGKTDERSLEELIDKYAKRIPHYLPFSIEVIPDIKQKKNLTKDLQKEKEGQLILDKVKPTDWLVLLDEKGRDFTSVAFAQFLQQKMNNSIKRLVFVIGGPYGFSETLIQKAHQKVSLSKMTFSHQMVRLFIVEQIYRACTILKGEPYHHE